jgi:hypothetical protein
MKRIDAICTAVLLTVLGAGRAEAFRMDPGLWRFTTITNMSFSRETKTETKTKCVTPETAADILKEMTARDCKIEDRKESADRLEWKMECHGAPYESPMRGTAQITTTGESIDGTMDMAVEIEGHRMTFKTTWKGRRIGECR